VSTVELDLAKVLGKSQIQVVRVDSRDLRGEPLHVTIIAGPYEATHGNAEEAWAARDAIAKANPDVADADFRVIQVFESEVDTIAIAKGMG
jgi:hypothetical protein